MKRAAKKDSHGWKYTAGLSILLVLILSGCSASKERTQNAQLLSPEEAVQRRIALDTRLEGAAIRVDFKDGTATLDGEVTRLGQKMIAADDLYEVAGVKSVVNNLLVVPPDVPDDKIARSIMRAIPSHCLIETEGINVKVRNGDVIITGTSQRLHHKDVITSIATFTDGVRSVQSRIVVLRSDTGNSGNTDEWIRKNVEGVIGSMVIRNNHVEVEVQEGVVTLNGVVPGYGTAAVIARAARHVPGVVSVRNRITPHVESIENFYLGGF